MLSGIHPETVKVWLTVSPFTEAGKDAETIQVLAVNLRRSRLI
jgi:hypothetical protein